MTTQLASPGASPLAHEKDPTDRSILIGIGCTLLFHILLVVLSPHFAFDDFSGVHTGIKVSNANQGKTFDFELAQAAEKERDPFRFVETNPDAPTNEPDKTVNFSNRNQQAAQQEKPTELDPERNPSITNAQDKIKNDVAIVTGNMAQPQLGAPPQPDKTKEDTLDQREQQARMEQVPIDGFDKTEGKSEDGIATNMAKTQSPTNQADQALEGARDSQDPNGGLVVIAPTQKTQPKERPRLSASQNRATILNNRAPGVANMGVIGMDARWSEYGEYLQELIEIVQTQWYRILNESRVSPPRGSHVNITFKINAQGETDIVKVEDFDSGKQGVFSCQNAIQARQPYRKWTEQMITVLGEQQTLTFAFYHQ